MEDQEKSNIKSDHKSLTLKLSYSPEIKNQLADAIDFVLEKIKFYPAEKFNPSTDHNEGLFVLKGLNDNFLTLDIKLVEPSAEFRYITFYTNDCLRDYHKYTLAGVEFISRPEYSNLGLHVDFIGHNEVRYSLLEERKYTDS